VFSNSQLHNVLFFGLSLSPPGNRRTSITSIHTYPDSRDPHPQFSIHASLTHLHLPDRNHLTSLRVDSNWQLSSQERHDDHGPRYAQGTETQRFSHRLPRSRCRCMSWLCHAHIPLTHSLTHPPRDGSLPFWLTNYPYPRQRTEVVATYPDCTCTCCSRPCNGSV
jgi:hypothetical protein